LAFARFGGALQQRALVCYGDGSRPVIQSPADKEVEIVVGLCERDLGGAALVAGDVTIVPQCGIEVQSVFWSRRLHGWRGAIIPAGVRRFGHAIGTHKKLIKIGAKVVEPRTASI
jgi:hypothetical protein